MLNNRYYGPIGFRAEVFSSTVLFHRDLKPNLPTIDVAADFEVGTSAPGCWVQALSLRSDRWVGDRFGLFDERSNYPQSVKLFQHAGDYYSQQQRQTHSS